MRPSPHLDDDERVPVLEDEIHLARFHAAVAGDERVAFAQAVDERAALIQESTKSSSGEWG